MSCAFAIERSLALSFSVRLMYATLPSFETCALPALVNGPTADWTAGSLVYASYALVIALLYLLSLTLPPDGATNTMGTAPFACVGKRCESRSVADWLSVPGRVRLSARLSPCVRSRTTALTRRTIQRAMTAHP